MSITKRHKPFLVTSKKLEKIGINKKYHTVGYLGEMLPKTVSKTIPMFSIVSAISGIPVYTKESLKRAEKAEGKEYYRDCRAIDYYNEAEFRARIILFLCENDYINDIEKWK